MYTSFSFRLKLHSILYFWKKGNLKLQLFSLLQTPLWWLWGYIDTFFCINNHCVHAIWYSASVTLPILHLHLCVSIAKIVIFNDSHSSHLLSSHARDYAKHFALSPFILTITLWVRCYYYLHFPTWGNGGSGRLCHLPVVSVQWEWQSSLRLRGDRWHRQGTARR